MSARSAAGAVRDGSPSATGPEQGDPVTDSSSDLPLGDRPRPQYGEYATPEEQAARIRQPLPAPARAEPMPAPAPPAPASWPEAAPAKRAASSPGRIVDRAVAIAMLAYGMLSLLSAIPAILDPAALLPALGLDPDDFAMTTTGAWGIAAAISLGLGWALTAWATWVAHKRGWIVFWIPIVGGFVFNTLAAILVSTPLLADPAVRDAILNQLGG